MSDVPYEDLRVILDAECTRRDVKLYTLCEAYADRFDVTPDGAAGRLRRGRDRGRIAIDEADRWLVLIDLTLDDLPNVPEPTGPPVRGGKRPGTPGRLTDAQVRACHVLYEQGASLRAIAAQVWERAGYASMHTAAEGIRCGFVRLGLPRRDRIEATIAARTTHGQASRGNKAAYKRWHRTQTGRRRPPCAGTSAKGRRCERPSLRDSAFCIAHDPERADQWRRIMDAAWSADRPRGERHHTTRSSPRPPSGRSGRGRVSRPTSSPRSSACPAT